MRDHDRAKRWILVLLGRGDLSDAEAEEIATEMRALALAAAPEQAQTPMQDDADINHSCREIEDGDA